MVGLRTVDRKEGLAKDMEKYSDSVCPGPDLKQYVMFGPSSDFLRLYSHLPTLNNGNCFLVVRSSE